LEESWRGRTRQVSGCACGRERRCGSHLGRGTRRAARRGAAPARCLRAGRVRKNESDPGKRGRCRISRRSRGASSWATARRDLPDSFIKNPQSGNHGHLCRLHVLCGHRGPVPRRGAQVPGDHPRTPLAPPIQCSEFCHPGARIARPPAVPSPQGPLFSPTPVPPRPSSSALGRDVAGYFRTIKVVFTVAFAIGSPPLGKSTGVAFPNATQPVEPLGPSRGPEAPDWFVLRVF